MFKLSHDVAASARLWDMSISMTSAADGGTSHARCAATATTCMEIRIDTGVASTHDRVTQLLSHANRRTKNTKYSISS